MKGRTGWVLGSVWLVTCLIGAWLPINILLAILAVGVIAYLITLCVPLLRHPTVLSAGVAILLCLGSLLTQEIRHYLPLSRLVGTTVSFRAQMCDTDDAAVLKVLEGDLPRGTKLYLQNRVGDSLPDAYEIVSGSFTLYGYDGKGLSLLRRKASGVYFSVSPVKESVLHIESGKVPWTAVFQTLRRQTVKKIRTHLTGDEGEVVSGICLGEYGGLSAQAIDAFHACGIWHLFSVSGFHLALITQALRWLLQKCRIPRLLCALAITACVLFFMALVGFDPSVVRSGTLCLLTQAAVCFKRQADSRNSLGIALLLLLVADPYAAYDAGLLLSFCATFGLLFLSPLLQAFLLDRIPTRVQETAPRRYRFFKRLVIASCVSLSASVATLPVMAVYFGEVSLVSLPANLLAAWPASALMIVGSLACLLFMVGGDALAGGFLFVAGWIARYLLYISEKISKIPLATVAIRDDYLLLWIVGSLLLLYIGWRVLRRRGVYLTAAVSAFVLSASLLLHTLAMRGVTQVTVIPTKDDVAVYARNSGRTVLFCAPQDVDDLYTVRAELRSDGIRRVDVLILYGGESTALSAVSAVLDSYLVGSVLLYTVAAEKTAETCAAAHAMPDGDIPLWEELSVSRSGEYFLLHVGETHIAIFPNDGAAYALPPRYRSLQAVICRGDVTESLEALPVVTLEEEPVVLMTRGRGDL
ncbi:MAG: ComEC/Rec2 family competence protein [Clostridia bacterium]|nr:ComEC/Rec2 family competence protein [Clostridia bacterium]